jgi:uncharacterized membrane protein (UPF0182 family)
MDQALPGAHAPAVETTAVKLPNVSLAAAPDGVALWSRLLVVGTVALIYFLLYEGARLLGDFWILSELGLGSLFRTNFLAGASLFAVGFVLGAAAVIAPALSQRVTGAARRIAIHAGLVFGLISGYFLSLRYMEFLLAFNAQPFGKTDPIFGHDIAFFVFQLPAIWTVWTLLTVGAFVSVISAGVCAYLNNRDRASASPFGRLVTVLAISSTPTTMFALAFDEVLLAIGKWLSVYSLAFKDNKDSSIYTGAEFLDVTGLFSTRNDYILTGFVVLGVLGAVCVVLGALNKAVLSGQEWRPTVRRAGMVAGALILLDFGFRVGISVREQLFVNPNEPVVQLPYIQRHIDATLTAYGLDRRETVRFVPKGPGDPVPSADELLSSISLKNAPLWPGFISWLERFIDPQHSERVLKTDGDTMVYGVTQEAYWQQQKLRPYYNFMDVDTARYTIGGEPKLFATAVREIPLQQPQPWLAYWGQRFMLFTHSWGLVMNPVSQATPEGDPVYASHGIPSQVTWPELAVKNDALYYAEGAGTMAITNVRDMREFDHPTEAGRGETVLPAGDGTGVALNSFVKRLVLGWLSGEPLNIVFSSLITPETRVHYYRTPMERLERIAPFLWFDTDPYAVTVDGRVTWMVHAIAHSDKYPYSRRDWLGDKSDERSPTPRSNRLVNYVEDCAKATIDGYTGEVRFYRFADGPLTRAYAQIYPDLFVSKEQMPRSLREHVQYSPQLFHLQYDEIYCIYQQTDAMTFFNQEDLWDDGDEVLGPILDEGKAIRFSIEPYYWLTDTGKGSLPAATRRQQFVQSMIFTPERALNLRAIPTVYQDWDDYGRQVILQVPKGHYFQGPEQADSGIDQDPEISSLINFWNRLGNEVIRGHTTAMVIGDEVVYVEPIFIRSRQNPGPQLKRVVVIFRERVVMGETLEEALRKAVAEAQEESGQRKATAPAQPSAETHPALR